MQMTEFVSAEDVQSPRYGVWVQLSTVSIMIDGEPRPVRFEVTTSTGYHAVLPACTSDACIGRTNCTRLLDNRGQHSGQSVNAWLKHIQTHCHDFHLPKAQWFAAQIAKTYG